MRRALAALIALAALWALAVAFTGGFDLRSSGIPFRSTDPYRPILIAAVLALVYAAAFRRESRTHVDWLDERLTGLAALLERRGGLVALALSALVLVLGYVYGGHAAGGSDSYGYISQADLWIARDLVVEQPIVGQVPWGDARWTFTPLGYVPTPDGGAIVPTYSYGLPVLMAVAKLVAGMCGLFLVTPLLGAVMVGSTYLLGARTWSRTVGVIAAALLASSPAFLFMQMNPMSDVPVSGLFAAALVVSMSRRPSAAFWTGAIVSLALLVRPNLVPLGAVFVAWRVWQAEGWPARIREAVWFSVGGFPLMAAIAVTNALVHGSPASSGYGSLDMYYAWGHIGENIRRYGSWLLESETPLVLLGLVPLALLTRLGASRARLVYLAAFAAAVGACYAFYTPYDAWWYLRFYLPAFASMFVLAAIGGWMLVGKVAPRHRSLISAGLLLAAFTLRIDYAREQDVMGRWKEAAIYTTAAAYVDEKLPRNAVILTVQHSGSIRYYANRLTMRWDWLGPEWWPRALDMMKELGYRPYLLVSRFEEAQLRKQFGFGERRDAPGTVVAETPEPYGVILYDPLREHRGGIARMAEVVTCPCAPR